MMKMDYRLLVILFVTFIALCLSNEDIESESLKLSTESAVKVPGSDLFDDTNDLNSIVTNKISENTQNEPDEDDPCSSDPCLNGGTCVPSGEEYFCICPNEDSGKLCEIVPDPCLENPCKNGGTCSTDGDSFICDCPTPYTGEICNMDPCVENPCMNGGNCSMDGGSFTCNCPTPFTGEICNIEESCSCGPHGRSCSISESGYKVCECEVGYSYVRSLDSCDYCMNLCGSDAVDCDWTGERTASCVCGDGYVADSFTNQCRPCDCGEYGNCSYRFVKECHCEEGYKELGGTCKECDCGANGKCYFNSSGHNACSCTDGFIENDGRCQECDCGSEGTCSLDSFGSKSCECPALYFQRNGRCVDCECGMGANCHLENGIKTCICPHGYEDKGGYCGDFDDCLDDLVCPSFTRCVNRDRGYDCECLDGYEKIGGFDPKEYGCQDIDECLLKSSCRGRGTRCKNLPGSYQCVCLDGYKPYTIADLPEDNVCHQESSAWTTFGIIIGALFAAILASAFIVLIIRCGCSRN